MQEWLYTDGEDATATEFQERLDMLKAIGDPIFFRYISRLLTLRLEICNRKVTPFYASFDVDLLSLLHVQKQLNMLENTLVSCNRYL